MNLEELRKHIDEIDERLFSLLQERLRLVEAKRARELAIEAELERRWVVVCGWCVGRVDLRPIRARLWAWVTAW